MQRILHSGFTLVRMVTPAASATGSSMFTARSSTAPVSTRSVLPAGRLSRRVRASRCSVMRVRRSASSPMSLTKSCTVSWSIWLFCKMESASRRMEARGVFSSWEASETKRRRTSSVVWSRSVSWLNSSASWAISSRPTGWSRWLYSPSRTMRMARSRAAIRRVRALEKTGLITRVSDRDAHHDGDVAADCCWRLQQQGPLARCHTPRHTPPRWSCPGRPPATAAAAVEGPVPDTRSRTRRSPRRAAATS